MKTLHMQHRGMWYEVSLEPDTLGHVMKSGNGTWPLPHPDWVIIGFSSHHWHNRITIPMTTDLPVLKIKHCFVWDRDHGTTRVWGGLYCGKLPRVQQAYITGEL